MQFRTLIVAALAATVAAERVPYKLAKKSVSLAALAARQVPGYQPEQTFCGNGETCAEACGSGYDQCPSTDGLSHCYHKDAGETCCMDANGNACEVGYYCAADPTGDTWCCPEGMSTEECANQYSVTGSLSSQIPTATSSAYHAGSTGSFGSSNNGTAVVTSSPSATSETSSDSDVVAASGANGLVASGAVAVLCAAVAAIL